MSKAESAIRRRKPRGFLFPWIRSWPTSSGHTGSVACTENPTTGYLRTARGSHAGRRAFCDGTSNRQRCVPGSVRLAGTRFGIPIRACYAEWVVASRAGALLNFADLSRSLSLPQTTLKRYFALLEATFLVQLLRPWSVNVGQRVIRTPKVYVNDTGLLSHLLGLTLERLLSIEEYSDAIRSRHL